jgi:hypothetical protein
MMEISMNSFILDGTTIPPGYWLQAIMGRAPISIATFVVTLHQGRCRIGHDNQWHGNYPARNQRKGLRSA